MIYSAVYTAINKNIFRENGIFLSCKLSSREFNAIENNLWKFAEMGACKQYKFIHEIILNRNFAALPSTFGKMFLY